MGVGGEQANEVRIVSAKIVMNLQHINSLLNHIFISVFPFQVKKIIGHLGQGKKGKDFFLLPFNKVSFMLGKGIKCLKGTDQKEDSVTDIKVRVMLNTIYLKTPLLTRVPS